MRAALTALVVMVLLTVAAPATADTVRIPAIGATAPVVPVGIGEGGSLRLGQNLFATYVWDRGVRPCRRGSFVLTAHAYEVPGGRALGNGFRQLGRGDRIHFNRCTYAVTSSRVVTASAARRSGCWDFDGKARGCAVTCVNRIGPGQYTHRRIVRFRLLTRR